MSRSAFEGTIEGERSLMTQPHTTRYRIVGARANCDSGEEPSALLGQPYERAALVQPKPAAFDRELETCAVFRRRAAQFVQERPVDQYGCGRLARPHAIGDLDQLARCNVWIGVERGTGTATNRHRIVRGHGRGAGPVP
jgi:hypothetical protein